MTIDKRVLPLALGGLGIGTTEFTIMGLLPDIADAMQVSIPQAGHFISAYALGVVVGAPLLIGNTVKYPPKKVLLGLMILFTVFNGLSAIVSNYQFMILSRFLSGLPHGAFFGVGTVVATTLASKGKQAQYISLMFAGLTVANLAMVPLVTYIGHTYDWRWYFGIVTLIGLVTIMALYLWLPDLPATSTEGFKSQIKFLTNRKSWYILLITSIGFGGLFAWFSYITPLMTNITGIAAKDMAYIMILAGFGMVIGNLLGGYLTDKIGASKTTIILLIALMTVLILIFFFSSNLLVSLILTFVCGGLSMSMGSPINVMMMRAVPGAQMMGAAFMQAAFNVANSAGAFFGGLPLENGYSYNYPSLVGAVMTFAGLLICLTYVFKEESKVNEPMGENDSEISESTGKIAIPQIQA